MSEFHFLLRPNNILLYILATYVYLLQVHGENKMLITIQWASTYAYEYFMVT